MSGRIEFAASRVMTRKRKSPAPRGTGDSVFLVAGVRDKQRKIDFPPVDIIEIPLVARGTVLVPLAA